MSFAKQDLDRIHRRLEAVGVHVVQVTARDLLALWEIAAIEGRATLQDTGAPFPPAAYLGAR
jgi:hypothetical protein